MFCRHEPTHGETKGRTHHRMGSSSETVGGLGIFLSHFPGRQTVHPGTYEVLGLLEEATRFGTRLREQAHRNPTLPTSLLRLIQTDFNKSSRQALERQRRVRWMDYNQLRQALATDNFRSENVALPGSFAPTPPPANQHAEATPDTTPPVPGPAATK